MFDPESPVGLRPVDFKYPISCPFGKEGPMWKSGKHSGIDFKCPQGAQVKSYVSGRVSIAHDNGDGYGLRVWVESGKYKYCYAHLKEFFVNVGFKVDQGTVIGLSGNTGNTDGPHLHFEARKVADNKAIEPIFYEETKNEPKHV